MLEATGTGVCHVEIWSPSCPQKTRARLESLRGTMNRENLFGPTFLTVLVRSQHTLNPKPLNSKKKYEKAPGRLHSWNRRHETRKTSRFDSDSNSLKRSRA